MHLSTGSLAKNSPLGNVGRDTSARAWSATPRTLLEEVGPDQSGQADGQLGVRKIRLSRFTK